jgi:8-oxo-dGTP pyrophosphatase MutT (NUDIX family)
MIEAAGIILRAPSGRVLVMQRAGEDIWDLPGGKVEDGEDASTAATREALEETGYRTPVDALVMRRVKEGVDYTTFIKDVEEEFIPVLCEEHSAFAWVDPQAIEEGSVPAQPIAISVAGPAQGNSVRFADSFQKRADALSDVVRLAKLDNLFNVLNGVK